MVTRLGAHVRTWRPYTLWYVGLVGLAGAGLAGGRGGALLLAWAVPTAGWIGGHYLGDWYDRELDALSKPQRPIPSGALPAATALACGLACLAAVTVAAVAGGPATTLVAAGAVAGIVGYARWFKARGIAGNLARGALGALVLGYGAAVAGGPVPVAALGAFLVAFWAHDTASNLVGTLRDVAGDRDGGYRTVPVTHGPRRAALVAAGCYGVAVAAALLGGALFPGPDLAFLLVLLPAVVLGAAALHPPLTHEALPARAALRAHELLVIERLGLACAVIAAGLGGAVAVTLLLPALAVTWWTQSRMRAAHEFGVAPSGAVTPDPGTVAPD
ncbi:MAG TPA: UbiA family prenyltransferase [Pseudonocardiaceae bacterium]